MSASQWNRLSMLTMAAMVAGVALTATASAQDLDGQFARTLQVAGEVDLEVRSGAGRITVRAGDDGTVQVDARIRARESSRYSSAELEARIRAIEANPPITQQGNAIQVGDLDEDARRGLRISYEITVPSAIRLRSWSGSGSQTVDDLAGPVEVSAGSGSLTIGRIDGRVVARAGSGSIRVDGARGELDASTGSGSIRASDVEGDIEASSGSVDLEQVGPGDARIQTGSGSVRIRGIDGGLQIRTGSGSISADGTMQSDWRLASSSGGITVELPPNAGFELDVKTRSGRIESRYPVTIVGSLSGRELHGQVGEGGPRLELRTTSGRIRIE